MVCVLIWCLFCFVLLLILDLVVLLLFRFGFCCLFAVLVKLCCLMHGSCLICGFSFGFGFYMSCL